MSRIGVSCSSAISVLSQKISEKRFSLFFLGSTLVGMSFMGISEHNVSEHSSSSTASDAHKGHPYCGKLDQKIMRQSLKSYAIILLLLLLLTGCQMTQSGFARTANDAGSAFAAASTTLTYAHTGKLTTAYAQTSFENYQSELSGVDQQ